MGRTLNMILGGLFPSLVFGDVVINEIATTHASRNLSWDGNEQPYAGAGPAWWSTDFREILWKAGSMPIGYSLGSISTDLGSDLRNVSPSFYTRKTFNASSSEAADSDPLVLTINYNDGFIAWLNGVEVARRNMGEAKAHIFHDQLAYRTSTSGTSTEQISLGTASSLLTPGDNVLAVQVNNSSLSGTMRLDMSLRINNPSGSDPELFGAGSSLSYLPGLREIDAGLVEPSLPASDPSDWVELHNNSAAAVDLTGWTLSDDPTVLSKWPLPAGTSIPAGGFLVILADDPDAPIAGAAFLHANFKLSGGGDYLALFDASGTMVSGFTPKYPNQYPGVSYGLDDAGEEMYFTTPTPGAANEMDALLERVDAPDFDQKGGFYDNAVVVTLTSETPGAAIRYTIDGTEPTLANGINYITPLQLAQVTTKKGHVIRARAFLAGSLPSRIKTNTYLIGQDARLRTSPALVYAGDPERSLYDPFGVMAINGGQYVNNAWTANGPADYNNVINRGRAYERAIHAEFYFADGTVGFRSDVGLRVAASSYSRPRMQLTQTTLSPWTSSAVQKPSFNLYFRDEYGNASADLPLNGPARNFSKYERFRVRAGKNDISNPFVIDELFRRLSHDMGNGASLGVINSLYVNAELKGYYNMVERLREPFFKSLHGSDNDAQWDVLQYEGADNVAEGDYVAWDDMINRLNASVTSANWDRVLEVADVENMADYYLLNIYGATWDWPHNNWVAARERSAEGKYRLYVWDAEGGMNNRGDRLISEEMIQAFIVGSVSGNSGKTGRDGELRDLWNGLNRWEEFRLIFADRIHKHLFNDGVLDDRAGTSSHVWNRFDGLVDEFSDLLRVVAGGTVQTSKVTNWISPTNGRRRYLFGPVREDFADNDLWPEITPPELSQFGGVVPENYSLLMTNEEGLVYYTIDGSDPRLFGGSPNPNAISQPGSLVSVTQIPLESVWAHNATDGDLGTAWRSLAYDDSAWATGAAPLGFGSIRDNGVTIPIATPVNGTARQPTSYFRKTFEIADPASFLGLNMTLLSDAGMVIYLNGVEALRESNVPVDAVYGTLPTADNSDGNEGDYVTYAIDPSLLVSGTNVIAVELYNDPRSSDMVIDVELSGLEVDPANLPVVINEPLKIKARSFNNGEWSALTEADFTVNSVPATTGNLAIAEFLYDPLASTVEEMQAGYNDGEFFEFIRLENYSQMNVDLSAVRFTDGVTFDFETSTIRQLAPGGVVILVRDLEAFRYRYGTSFDSLIGGEYEGKLSDGGESLRLIGEGDVIIHEFEFESNAPWPVLDALDGHSIVLNNPSDDHGLGGNWRASAVVGGTPSGSVDFAAWQASFFTAAELTNSAISGPDADPDGDGWTNFMEFALGALPRNAQSVPLEIAGSIEDFGGQEYLTLSYTRTAGLRAVTFSAEVSDELQSWSAGGVPILPQVTNPDGTITARFRHPLPVGGAGDERYLRLRVDEQ